MENESWIIRTRAGVRPLIALALLRVERVSELVDLELRQLCLETVERLRQRDVEAVVSSPITRRCSLEATGHSRRSDIRLTPVTARQRLRVGDHDVFPSGGAAAQSPVGIALAAAVSAIAIVTENAAEPIADMGATVLTGRRITGRWPRGNRHADQLREVYRLSSNISKERIGFLAGSGYERLRVEHLQKFRVGPPRIELGSYGPHPQRIPLPHGPALGSKAVCRLRVSFRRRHVTALRTSHRRRSTPCGSTADTQSDHHALKIDCDTAVGVQIAN